MLKYQCPSWKSLLQLNDLYLNLKLIMADCTSKTVIGNTRSGREIIDKIGIKSNGNDHKNSTINGICYKMNNLELMTSLLICELYKFLYIHTTVQQ